MLQAFTIFCGLGINNCLLYDEVAKASAKQTVALEVSVKEIDSLTTQSTSNQSNSNPKDKQLIFGFWNYRVEYDLLRKIQVIV